jgi:hypothetical protein
VYGEEVVVLTRLLDPPIAIHPTHSTSSNRLIGPSRGSDRGVSGRPGDLTCGYGAAFGARVKNLGIKQLKSAPRSPWQNGYAERWVGTLRRELLDHVIVLGERHLLHLVRKHVAYYNDDRPHMALRADSPVGRAVETPATGDIISLPRVGGLHHRYSRAA